MKIRMTIINTAIFPDNPKGIATEMNDTVYSNKSGVKTLLELDPLSKVVIHKADGTTISYEYVV